MNLMDNNNSPVTQLDNQYFPDPTYDKLYGITFDISFNDTYRGAFNVSDTLKFIHDFLVVPNPASGTYHVKEVSPAKPSGEAIDMLDIVVRNLNGYTTIDIYDQAKSSQKLYNRVQFGEGGVTQAGVNFILGFIQGWAAGVAANSSRF